MTDEAGGSDKQRVVSWVEFQFHVPCGGPVPYHSRPVTIKCHFYVQIEFERHGHTDRHGKRHLEDDVGSWKEATIQRRIHKDVTLLLCDMLIESMHSLMPVPQSLIIDHQEGLILNVVPFLVISGHYPSL